MYNSKSWGAAASTYLEEKAAAIFKETLVSTRVAERLNISIGMANILIKRYFNTNSIIECRNKVEAETHTPFGMIHASPEHIEKIHKAHAAFHKCGTLEKAGQTLGLTRERVRQLLKRGHSFGIIHYDGRNDKNLTLQNKLNSITKERLEEAINTKRLRSLCKEVGIGVFHVTRVLKKYGMNVRKVITDGRHKQILIEYNTIVEILGRHPSSQDLQHTENSKFRRFHTFIANYFGGLTNFRRKYGINFIAKEHRSRTDIPRTYKKALVFCQRNKTFRRSELTNFLSIDRAPTFYLLRKLRKNNVIKLVRSNIKAREIHYQVIQ